MVRQNTRKNKTRRSKTRDKTETYKPNCRSSHIYHKYSMQCLTGRAYSGARKTFVSVRIGQSYSNAYFAYKLARPRRLNM